MDNVFQIFLPIILAVCNNCSSIAPANTATIFTAETSETWVNYSGNEPSSFDAVYTKQGLTSRKLGRVVSAGGASGLAESAIQYSVPLDLTAGGTITSAGIITGWVYIPPVVFPELVSASSVTLSFVDTSGRTAGFSHNKTTDEFGVLNDLVPGWNIMKKELGKLQESPLGFDETQVVKTRIIVRLATRYSGPLDVYFDDFRVASN